MCDKAVFPERMEQDASAGEEGSILGDHKEQCCSVCLPDPHCLMELSVVMGVVSRLSEHMATSCSKSLSSTCACSYWVTQYPTTCSQRENAVYGEIVCPRN